MALYNKHHYSLYNLNCFTKYTYMSKQYFFFWVKQKVSQDKKSLFFKQGKNLYYMSKKSYYPFVCSVLTMKIGQDLLNML